MMENRNWREYKFSEFVNINPFVSLKANEEYSFVEMKDLEDGNKYCFPKIKKIKGGGSKFQNGDTLFARITPCLENGKICQVKGLENNLGFGSTEFYVFRGREEISDTEFVYYLSRWNDVRDHAEINLDGTSGRQRVPKASFDDLIIQMPELPEQKAIASVLSSLDDKIELLHQQNQTLEALAETLFRKWFVEEAKEDWEVLPLCEIAEVKNGKSFKSSDFTDNDFNSYEVVKMGHIERGGGLKLNPKKDFVSREMDVEKWILNKGDIIMAMTDMKDNVVILGVPAMIDKDDHYVLNQRVARIYLKDNSKLISNYLLYIQLNNKDFIAELQTKANSGVQVNLSTEAIKESEILIPPFKLQEEFGHKIIDLYSKIEINREQIQTLTQLRDTLLPKLMSGEVRVKM
ncbi:restriction endonuclease subunit S [Sphingobacterium thalpophilum]|uniref:restriction endonuclease subunit S n=1 Tax=Sphingobacterium thalpophilum TaxID=259 RepID=UPI003C7383B8